MQRILVYLLRRDLRLADNPVFTQISRLNSQSQKPFTHLLPVYVLPANQIEVSGLVPTGQKSPYPEARSSVAGFWRCGKLRAKFTAESIWDLKSDLEQISSGLVIRAGTLKDVVQSILKGYREIDGAEIHGIWMTSEEGWEEKVEEEDVRQLSAQEDVEFSLRNDEKYFVDDRDLPFKDVVKDLSDVFTTYRKQIEPLRSAPRKEFPAPKSLPPLPDFVPEQAAPFKIPDTLDNLVAALHKPLDEGDKIANLPDLPQGAKSAHPFKGGSKAGQDRISHLVESGSMTAYKDTRNGLLGLDFSTKLSAWLALGCISARQVHWRLIEFEDGTTELGNKAQGYGKGESKGSAAVRFELLWRDYMRLCTKKFGSRLFLIDGYRQDHNAKNTWKSSPYTTSTNKKNKGGVNDHDTRVALERFLTGHTGTGLIDASQRELWLTGWTSNRARQNVASYLAKRLWIDWRIGAEWYEMNLVDHDVSSNWGNWQYVSGVGNDPRGDARVFNPVKQAYDYDSNGEYVRTWIPELRQVAIASSGGDGKANPEGLQGVFQAWKMPVEEKKRIGLDGVEWVEKPLVRIDFSVNRRGGSARRGGGGGGGGGGYRGRGRGRGRGS